MPAPRYFLADVVLTALFTLRDRDCHALMAAFDQIAENPHAMAVAIDRDWDGRLVCIAQHGRFRIGYVIAGTETVTFTLLRPIRS